MIYPHDLDDACIHLRLVKDKAMPELIYCADCDIYVGRIILGGTRQPPSELPLLEDQDLADPVE